MNTSTVEEFWMVGFENIHNLKILVFLLVLISYIVTVSANMTIVSMVLTSRYIDSPMYFFLGHLSFNDVIITTNIVPEMLCIILNEGSALSPGGCFTQIYFLCQSAITECLLLTIMSYDRYLAICNSLRYSSIMDLKLCIYLVVFSWGFGLLLALPHIVILTQISFCGSNVIDHFYCDLIPLLKLSCSETLANEIVIILLSLPVTFCPLAIITWTYICIFLAIHQISTTTGKRKAFSTCSSHLSIVCLYYGTLMFNYLLPSKQEFLGLQKLFSALYTIVTPLLNPVIYSLRNEQIRGSIINFILRKKR